jgi:preprotein translocase subunit SecA
LYEKVAGMTGTALTSAEEFLRVYGLDTVAVPTHRGSQRQDLNDLIFLSEDGKWRAIANKVKAVHETGQPVLIGTISIEKNELLAAYLKRAGVPHAMLNAKNHEQEGQIIAEAGKKGSVVVATNMAGRGVDIKLGGAQATGEQAEEIKKLGGLYVLGTERHEARRIDNQLRGRSGRQGDPGVTQFFVSLDDPLIRTFAPESLKGLIARLGLKPEEAIEHRLVSRAIENAQEKIEGFNFDARKHLLDYDNVLNHQRTAIYTWRNEVLFGALGVAEQFVVDIGLDEEAAKLLANKKQALGEQIFDAELRRLILQVIDLYWIEHLEAMEHMRASVRLRAYGQRDPLVEYKREGLRMFRETEEQIKSEVIKLLPNLGMAFRLDTAPLTQSVHESVLNPVTKTQTASISNKASEVGRNDDCPCGSGKKYKKCGLLNTPEHQQLMAKK